MYIYIFHQEINLDAKYWRILRIKKLQWKKMFTSTFYTAVIAEFKDKEVYKQLTIKIK